MAVRSANRFLSREHRNMSRLGWGVVALGLFLAAYVFLRVSGVLHGAQEPGVLQHQIGQLGFVGPVAIIVLLAVAIVFVFLVRARRRRLINR